MPMFQPSVSGGLASDTDVRKLYHITAWGDSFTDIGAPWFQNAVQGFGIHYRGFTGESSTQIKTRMLAETARHNDISIIWVGRNNFASGSTVKADIAAMVAALSEPRRYLIVSIVNGVDEVSGSANYNTIVALNLDLAALYGANYLDARALLVAAYNPALPQDVIDHGNDVPPLSLRNDSLHFNPAGARIVAAAIAAWVNALDLDDEPKALNYADNDAFREMAPPQTVANFVSGGAIRFGGQIGLAGYSTRNNFYLAGAKPPTAENTGEQNVAIGGLCMGAATSATGNMGLGYAALRSLTTGDGNMAIGVNALSSTSDGFNLVAVGTSAFINAAAANNSVALGYAAGAGMVTGSGNVLIGASTAITATALNGVTAVGSGAMRNATAGYNTAAYGGNALYKFAGSFGTALGVDAAQQVTAGDGVTAVGCEALKNSVTPVRSTAVGYRAGLGATGQANILLGAWAGDKETGNDRLAVDNRSRASESAARDLSIIYGEMADTAGAQKLRLNAATRVLTTTASGLPAATIGAGYRAFVTDANATTFASVVAGGGSNGVPVYSDGTNWRIG